MNPMVSLSMPTFRHARFLRQALDSVFAQTFGDFEITVAPVVGDTETLDILKTYTDPRMKVVVANYALITHQMNIGLMSATGKYSMIFDSDDWLYPDALERLVKFSEERNAIIAHPDYCLADENLKPRKHVVVEEHNWVDYTFVLRSEYRKYIPLRFSDGWLRTERVWRDMMREADRSRCFHFPGESFLYRIHGEGVHLHGSQDDFRIVTLGKSESLGRFQQPYERVDKKMLRKGIPRRLYCVYVVEPALLLMHFDKFQFKRLIIHWDDNNFIPETALKFKPYPYVHHLVETNDIFHFFRDNDFGIHIYSFPTDELKAAYIREERYDLIIGDRHAHQP